MKNLLSEWKVKFADTGRRKWFLLFLLGILMIVITLPTSSDIPVKKVTADYLREQETESMTEKTVLEKKLEELLESVNGVGNVQVMIMTGEEQTGDYYTVKTEKVTGVLISAEGADNSVIIKNIQEAVMALFQVDAHKIKVMKMK